MSERVRFCRDCSCVPKGVIAEVENIEFMNRRKLNERELTAENTSIGDQATLIAEITAVAVEVDPKSDVEVDDEAKLLIVAGTQTREEIEQSIKECPGNKRTLTQKLLGHRGTCQAVEVA
jgi:hypothetical protein